MKGSSIKKNKFANFVEEFEKYFPAFILIFILLILTASVFFRYVLRQPLVWTDEASKYLFIWLIFTSASYAGRLEQHITIDALQSVLPRKVRIGFQLIGRLLWLSFCIFFTITSAIYTKGVFDTGSIAITIPWLKLGFVYMAIPIGYALLSLHLIFHMPNWKTEFIAKEVTKEEILL